MQVADEKVVNELKVNLENLPELPPDSHSFFLVAERWLTLPGGVRVSVREAGDGSPVLLLAGVNYGAYSFRYLFGARERFRLVLVDPFGPEGLRLDAATGMDTLQDFCAALEPALDIGGALWVAHGEFALAALVAGQRHQVNMRALVAISPPSPPTRWQRLQEKLSGQSGRLERLARRLVNDPFRAAAELVEYADVAVISRQELRWLARRLSTLPAARVMAGQLLALAHPDFTRPLEQLLEQTGGNTGSFPAPLSILAGAAGNPAVQEFARTLNRAFTGSELLLVENCGDAVQAEQPGRVLEVLDSLTGS